MARAPLPSTEGESDLATCYNALKRAFRQAGLATPDLDARLLVTETLDVTTAQLIANPRLPVPAALAEELERRAKERLSGRSIGRILGRRAFWSLDLRIGPATLEPRPETETVVELALAALQPPDRPALVADLGVGTGAILLAILTERPNALGVGIDISEAALREAERNAERHALNDRALFAAADFGAALAPVFDVVVSNPPYVETALIERLDPTVRDHDPRLALDGGPDGLDAYRTVFAQACGMMRAEGTLIVEIAPGASEAVISEAARHRLTATTVARDLNGDQRAIALQVANG